MRLTRPWTKQQCKGFSNLEANKEKIKERNKKHRYPRGEQSGKSKMRLKREKEPKSLRARGFDIINLVPQRLHQPWKRRLVGMYYWLQEIETWCSSCSPRPTLSSEGWKVGGPFSGCILVVNIGIVDFADFFWLPLSLFKQDLHIACIYFDKSPLV